MTSTQPRLSDTDPETAPFWAATSEGRLEVQKCLNCGYLRWPPGPLCNECSSDQTAWTEVRPEGTLWSVATYHRALDPRFKDEIPYSVGLIELDEGPRMYGRMQGDPARFVPGTHVHAAFRKVSDDMTLVDWVPDGTGEQGGTGGVR